MKKSSVVWLVIILMIALSGVTSCKKESTTPTPPAVTYTLSVIISPAGSGTVAKSPDQTSYSSGATVTLTATPASGYKFVRWDGDVTGTNPTATVTMNANKAVTAVFAAINQYTLNVQVSPAAGGTVTKSPDQSSYTEGSTVTLTATAAAGYVFSSWSGDATGTTNPLTVTMNSNKTIIANFTQLPTYTLTVTNVPAAGGTVTKSPDATSYPQGSTVTLTASPAYGYVFSSWSGDVTGTTNPVTVTMDGNKAVTANYTALTRYMLLTGKYVTAVASPDDTDLNTSLAKGSTPVAFGTITKTPNYDTYASGTVVTLTATPVAGFTKFVGWYSSATQMDKYTLISASPSIQITMDGHKQAYALFAVIWNKLAVVYDDAALTVAFSGSKTFPYDGVTDMNLQTLVLKQAYMPTGTKFKLSATPTGSSYQFVQWQGDISSTKNPTDYIIINNDMSVTAVHKTLSQINVTVEPATTYGTVTIDPVKTYYEPGDTVTVTATPNPGYKFVGWSGDLTSTANPATFTVPSVNNKTSYTIKAEFAIQEPTIKLDPTSLSFKANYDGADPAAKTVIISNNGGGNLVIDGAALADWLAKEAPIWINKDNVTLSGTGPITIDPSTNVTLTVSVQTHNPTTGNPFDRGTYTVQIPITSPQATNSPQYVTVTFVIE